MPWGFLWFVSRVLGFTFPVVLVVGWVFGLALLLLCIPHVYLGASYGSFLNKTLITYKKKVRVGSCGNVDNVDGLAVILGCMVSSWPLKYLGISLGAFYKSKSIWDGVIEKIERQLDN
jgi:hypothetical protein